MKRTVLCIQSVGLDEQRALQQADCQHLSKPEATAPCHRDVPCPSQWAMGNWSEVRHITGVVAVSCKAGRSTHDVPPGCPAAGRGTPGYRAKWFWSVHAISDLSQRNFVIQENLSKEEAPGCLTVSFSYELRCFLRQEQGHAPHLMQERRKQEILKPSVCKSFPFVLAEALKTFRACRGKVLQASQRPSCAMHVSVGGWTSALHPHMLAMWLPCLCCQAALGSFTAIYLKKERSIKAVFSGHSV